MKNAPLFILILSLFLSACADDSKKQQAFLQDIESLHTVGDSMTKNIKTDMRTINLQISDMVDNGVNIDLLGSFVDAYKEKERKFNKCKSSWDKIYNKVNTASIPDFSAEEITAMKEKANSVNDSLKTLSSEMAKIHSQAMGILQEAREKGMQPEPAK